MGPMTGNLICTKNIVFSFIFVSAVVFQFMFLLFILLFDNNIQNMARRMRVCSALCNLLVTISTWNMYMYIEYCLRASCSQYSVLMDVSTWRARSLLRNKRQKLLRAQRTHKGKTFEFHYYLHSELFMNNTNARNVLPELDFSFYLFVSLSLLQLSVLFSVIFLSFLPSLQSVPTQKKFDSFIAWYFHFNQICYRIFVFVSWRQCQMCTVRTRYKIRIFFYLEFQLKWIALRLPMLLSIVASHLFVQFNGNSYWNKYAWERSNSQPALIFAPYLPTLSKCLNLQFEVFFYGSSINEN